MMKLLSEAGKTNLNNIILKLEKKIMNLGMCFCIWKICLELDLGALVVYILTSGHSY